jgi:hypothetical protein
MTAWIMTRWTMTTVLLASTVTLSNPATKGVRYDRPPAQSQESDCSFQTDIFPLRDQDLMVSSADGGVLFEAGMTIDADGAPNAYGPHNRGLDYTANARGAEGWVSLVTNRNGHPVIQKSGPYRGYYVSTTSLQQGNSRNERDPRRYIDATRIPYIALPPDFASKFEIHLGDLAVVVNRANGLAAYAIFADVGPKGRIGEGSIALARQLGIPSNPRHDSAVDGVIYLVFPGSAPPAGSRITVFKVRSSASRLYRRWGGTERLEACD